MKRTLSVFMLVMINVAAIGSVKNWPALSAFGSSSLFFFSLATLLFFLPTALVSAELATGWPKMGGIFVWVKEAFGHRIGFLAIWLLWIENVVWYPTILSFIAGTCAYIFAPDLADNPIYITVTCLCVFWGATAINLLGMRISGWVSTLGVIFGTLIPGGVIISLGIAWWMDKKPLQIVLDRAHLIPDLSSPQQWVFFTMVLLSLAGIEMSAVHARDVRNPQKNYPKAILLSALLILGMSLLGIWAIAIVLPQHEINLTAGSIQALASFMQAYGMGVFIPLLVFLLIFGAVASLSTWIVGPSRGLLAAADQGDLPPVFRKLNRHGMPVSLLFVQGGIVTLLSLLFLFMPSVNAAYWLISVLVAEAYLIMYLLMFAAAIYLRYKRADVKRAYRVPGGNIGMWIVAGIGMASSFFALIIGFLPPPHIQVSSPTFYFLFLLIGITIALLAPSLILCFKKKSWKGKQE